MMLFQLAEFTFPNFPTTTQGWIFEVVGIVASLFVFISFFWSNEKITRIINMAGCVIFVIYALLIGSLSVMVMNAACLVLHIVKLVQMRNKTKKDKTDANCDSQTDGSGSEDSAEQSRKE